MSTSKTFLFANNLTNKSNLITGKISPRNIPEILSGTLDVDLIKSRLNSGNYITNNKPTFAQTGDEGGYLWYDEISNTLRVSKTTDVNTWSSINNINTGRYDAASTGDSDENIIFGGREQFTSSLKTEYFDGLSWSNVSNLNNIVEKHAGAGNTNAALKISGDDESTITEEYDGVSWSIGVPIITGRTLSSAAGTQTSAVSFGGKIKATLSNITEEFNGTSWSSSGNMITSRYSLAGSGTQIAAVAFGGNKNSYSADTEEYDGTSWSASSSMITPRTGLAGSGTQNLTLAYGGFTEKFIGDSTFVADSSNILFSAESYDGLSWSSSQSLIQRRYDLSGSGGSGNSFAVSGRNAISWQLTTAEYYSFTVTAEKTLSLSTLIKDSVFTIKSNMNTPRKFHSGVGNNLVAIFTGGNSDTFPISVPETWDGLTFASQNYIGTNFLAFRIGNDNGVKTNHVCVGNPNDFAQVGGYTNGLSYFSNYSQIVTYDGTTFSVTVFTDQKEPSINLTGGGTSSQSYIIINGQNSIGNQNNGYTFDGTTFSGIGRTFDAIGIGTGRSYGAGDVSSFSFWKDGYVTGYWNGTTVSASSIKNFSGGIASGSANSLISSYNLNTEILEGFDWLTSSSSPTTDRIDFASVGENGKGLFTGGESNLGLVLNTVEEYSYI